MIYVAVNQPVTAVLRIPDSQVGDTVTYLVIKANDGLTFASGNATFVAHNLWRVTFTPIAVDEVYVVRLDDATLDVQTSESFKAVTAPQVAVQEGEAQTSEALFQKVNAAISALLNSGAIHSYMIGGRNIVYMTLADLTNLRDKLKREVNATKDTRSFAQFGNPS